MRKPQVVIVGRGFTGIAAAKSLRGRDADVTRTYRIRVI
jgi:NADH dehydrogenase FAD-containing subunit